MLHDPTKLRYNLDTIMNNALPAYCELTRASHNGLPSANAERNSGAGASRTPARDVGAHVNGCSTPYSVIAYPNNSSSGRRSKVGGFWQLGNLREADSEVKSDRRVLQLLLEAHGLPTGSAAGGTSKAQDRGSSEIRRDTGAISCEQSN